MALVQQYGSIDAVYANIDSVPLKPGFLCKLKEGEASARHSYWLATIDTNAPLDFDPEDNLRQPFKPEPGAGADTGGVSPVFEAGIPEAHR